MMERPTRLFPPGLVDSTGRRLRLGSYVVVRVNGTESKGEVTGWAGPRRGIEVTCTEPPSIAIVQPIDVTRLDEPNPEPLTVGWMPMDDTNETAALLVPLGTRDIQTVTVADPHLSPVPDGRQPDLRTWALETTGRLDELDHTDQLRVIQREIDMPMLRRVLAEASLPDHIDAIVFVATDQRDTYPADTASLLPIACLWLEANGHLDTTDESTVRTTGRVETIVLTALPHILDAVVHQTSRGLDEINLHADRLCCILAGGTPAMMYGTTLAAVRTIGASRTRTIQVPADLQLNGDTTPQSLIEMDVGDSELA